MPKKKHASIRNNQTSITVRNVSDVRGSVNVAAGNITTGHNTEDISVVEIGRLFDQLYSKIEARPNTSTADKEDLKAEVEEIQSTVTQAARENKKVGEGFLLRRFCNIARMAPDVLDVVVATVANPMVGLGIAVKKIAEKAKSETKAL